MKLCLLIALFCLFGLVASQCSANKKCAKCNGKCASCTITCSVNGCCGNGICEAHESCSTCPNDCGFCASCDNICGNQLCDVNENGCNCPQDCGPCCLDNQCSGPETFTTCPGECGGALSLRAFDASTGMPINLASVTCLSNSYTTGNLKTDSTGVLVVGMLEPNSYQCTVTAPGYYPNSASFWVAPGGLTPVPQLVPLQQLNAGTFSGLVLHATSNGFLRGANVSCTNGNFEIDTITSAEGFFEFHGLGAGTYTCIASLPGYQSSTMTLILAQGASPSANFVLTPNSASLALMVVDFTTGLPLQNVLVSCSECIQGTNVGSGQTAMDGTVNFAGISAERAKTEFTCTFSLKSYFTWSETYMLSRGETSTGVVALRTVAPSQM